MSEWTWVYDFRRRARETGDAARIKLYDLYSEANSFKHSDPDHAIALLDEGRALARTLGEPWWDLFFQHWHLQFAIYYKGDYVRARDLAVRAVVEARRPVYTQLPQRICLHEDLIAIYVGTDPAGHAGLIRDAMAYMESEITPDLQCRLCLQELRAGFALDLDRVDEAATEAMCYLSMSDSDAYHLVGAHSLLCQVAYRRGDWATLREHAEAGEVIATRKNRVSHMAESVAWQALVARHEGREEAGRRLYRRATALVGRGKAVPEQSYFSALSAYHEVGEQLHLALRTRRRQLDGLIGKGRIAAEAHCRIEVCRLLARLGHPTAADIAASRVVAEQLIDPTPALDQLNCIENIATP